MKKGILAIVTAALLFVCGMFGGLAKLPLAGMFLKPIIAYAADATVVFNGTSVEVTVNNTTTTHYLSSGDDLDLSSLTDSDGNKLSGKSLEIHVNGNTTWKSMYHDADLTIIGGGGELTAQGGIALGTGCKLTLQDASVTTYGFMSHHVANGIHLPDGTLSVTGNSRLTVQAYQPAVGIHAENVDISGGTVNVKGYHGIYISSGTVQIAAGTTVTVTGDEYGIDVISGSLNIADGANVNITGTNGAILAYNHDYSKITVPGGYTQGATNFMSGSFIRPSVIHNASASPCATGHASYTWQTVAMPDVHNDGEEVCVCAGCGQVLYRVPLSAYGPFQKVTAEKIQNAAQGATVEITTSRWYSFHRSVMEALAARPDVTLVVSFLREEYKGDRLTFTIPAGTDTVSLLNEEGYVGFQFLGGMFGLKPGT